jgi:hypothetical protein
MGDTNDMDKKGRVHQQRFKTLYRASTRFPIFMKAILTLLVEESQAVPLQTRGRWDLEEVLSKVEPSQRKRVQAFLKEHGPGAKAQIWSRTSFDDQFTLTEGFVRWLAPFWTVLRGGELTREHLVRCSGFANDGKSVGNIIEQLWSPDRAVMGEFRLEARRSRVGNKQRVVYSTVRLVRYLHKHYPEMIPSFEEPDESIDSMFGEAPEPSDLQLSLDFKEPSAEELQDTVEAIGSEDSTALRAARILGRHGPLRKQTLADLIGVDEAQMDAVLHDNNAWSKSVEEGLFLKNGQRGKPTWSLVRLSRWGLIEVGLYEHLAVYGRKTSDELAGRLGVSVSLIRESARVAEENGQLRKVGRYWETAA